MFSQKTIKRRGLTLLLAASVFLLVGLSACSSDENPAAPEIVADVDGYLAAYSRDFKPNGSSRSAWEATRRERLRAPEFIKVSITQLEITRVQDNLVRASFFQTYRSDRFSDAVRTEVEMVWEEGAWKIWRELAR